MSFQVGNKNIDNASGQVVRLDIQNTIKTVANNNFGQMSQAGDILPCEFLADSDTNKLFIRKSSGNSQAKQTLANGNANPEAATFFEVGDLDTANLGLLPKSGGTLTGVLQLPTGSVSTPALNVGDTGTGLFKPSSNVLGITADGTQKINVKSTATEFFGNATSGAKVRFYEGSNQGNQYVEFKAKNAIPDPGDGNNLVFTLPFQDGSNGDALLTNGSGELSFGTPTVGAANLSGNTLASGVTASSLTSVGTLTSLTSSGNITTSGNISGNNLLLSGEIYLGDGAESADDHTFFDAQIGTTKVFQVRSVSGGDANHNVIASFEHDGTNGKVTADKFIGDGSALTGITSLVKQIKEVTAISQQEVNADNAFHDVLTLTLNNTSSTSRVLVLSTFRIHTSTPYNTNRFARAKTTIGENGSFAGNRQDEALNNSSSSSSDAHHSTILLDENSTSGNREYRIRLKKDTTGKAFIANARLIAIEFEVS